MKPRCLGAEDGRMDTSGPTSSSVQGAFPLRLILAIAVAAVLLGVAFAGIAKATDQPGFCGSACHEMAPFHTAWTSGAHKDIACVECHVDVGTVARMEHKVVALKEVAAHVTGDPKFPLEKITPVPSERCIRCHAEVNLTSPGFSHAEHAKRGECYTCHATVGHDVSVSALKEAGVYNSSTKAAFDSTKTAVVDGGKANLTGHVAVPCSRCHDMAASTCSECHKPKHVDRGKDCTVCHSPGAKFVFTHPARNDCATCHTPKSAKHTWKGECTDCHKAAPGVSFQATHPTDTACETCHARPANHRTGACTTCHQNAGKNWAYAHPGSAANCASCHPRPSGHRGGSCVGCHKAVGKSWTFSHPGSKANCVSCHARPSGHRGGSCTSCHKVARSWRFSHPGNRSNCSSCHSRPGGHRSGACQSCHSTGSKWTFRHSGSLRCSSCHKAPSGHYGSTCKNCHSPGKSWTNATFSHPRIPGGEHSSRSFACTKCHPGDGKGPGHFCSCHGNTTGPEDD